VLPSESRSGQNAAVRRSNFSLNAAYALPVYGITIEQAAAKDSVGPGNIVLIELASSNVTEMFCGFGRIGANAGSVGSEAADAARSHVVSGAAAGEHLTDQLLLPFALAGGGTFTASTALLSRVGEPQGLRGILESRTVGS
jgi:RNA 3'-terminal phosphate cyclase